MKNGRKNKTLRYSIYIIVYVGTLIALFGGSFRQHFSKGMRLEYYNDDVRQQVWPFFRYSGQGLLENNYIADYYLSGLPIAYKALYALAAKFWNLYTVSSILPYVLFLLTVLGIGLASHKLSGWAGSWMSVAFMLSSTIYLERMTGGLPRSFAFPLFAWLCVALVYGKPTILFVVTVLGAGFYPVVACVGGVLLFGWCFIIAKSLRGVVSEWSLLYRSVVLAVLGALIIGLVVPVMMTVKPFGPMLPSKEFKEFPELAPKGRYEKGHERLPFPSILTELVIYTQSSLSIQEKTSFYHNLLWFVVCCLAVLGMYHLISQSVEAKRLGLLFIVSSLFYFLAQPLSPQLFFPQRYLLYTIPLLVTIFLPAAIYTLLGHWLKHRNIRKFQSITVAVLGAALILTNGARGISEAGFTREITEHHELYEFVGSLPNDVLLAGWPTGAVENIPYLCKRSVLICYETHQAFHRSYTLEMRQRMSYLIIAYFATDLNPILQLKEKFGITHLLLDTRNFGETVPRYFRPFNGPIKVTHRKMRSQGGPIMLQEPYTQSIVFQNGPFILFDLVHLNQLASAPRP